MLRIVHLLTLFYVIVLTLLLEMPNVPSEYDPIPSPMAVCKHIAALSILGFLIELGRTRKSMTFWLGILLLYATTAEAMQWVLEPICHRYFDWQDMLHNVVGVLLGVLIGYFCRPLVKRPSKTLDKMG